MLPQSPISSLRMSQVQKHNISRWNLCDNWQLTTSSNISTQKIKDTTGKMQNAENQRRVFCGILMRNNKCGMVGKMRNGILRNASVSVDTSANLTGVVLATALPSFDCSTLFWVSITSLPTKRLDPSLYYAKINPFRQLNARQWYYSSM